MNTKSSHQSFPSGLELYSFEYPDGWKEMPATVTCLDGECDPAPTQCFLQNDTEAAKFAKLYGAIRATHAITGRIILPETS